MTNLIVSRAKELATLINENEAQIKSLGQSMIDRAIASGRHLIEIKEMLPHGEFMPFCRDNVAVKKSQLAKYMKAASEESRLPEYSALEGGLEKGLAGFINFLSPEKPADDHSNFHSSGSFDAEVIEDEPSEVWHDELESVRAIRDEQQFRAEMATMPVKPMIVDDSYLSDLVALASSACFHINNYEFRGGKTVTAEKLADMFVIEMNRFAEKTDDPQEAYAERHGQCLRGLPLLLEAVQLISSNKPAKLTVIK